MESQLKVGLCAAQASRRCASLLIVQSCLTSKTMESQLKVRWQSAKCVPNCCTPKPMQTKTMDKSAAVGALTRVALEGVFPGVAAAVAQGAAEAAKAQAQAKQTPKASSSSSVRQRLGVSRGGQAPGQAM